MAISLIIGVPVNGKTFGYFLSLEPRNIGVSHEKKINKSNEKKINK